MSGKYVRPPCIEYSSKFEHSKLEKIELMQTWDDGTKSKNRFNSICRQLEITDGEELFDNFTEALTNQAENKWETITMNIPVPQRTVARFRQAMEDFYLSYCDDDARDNMFDYLRNFSKPFNMAAGDHADRMEILVKYANTLPGMEPPMTDDQKKRLIFESYPIRWQHAYIQSGRRIQSESLIKIVQYMKDEKSFSDSGSNKRKRNEDDNQLNSNRAGRGTRAPMRGGGRTGRGRGRSRSNPCRIHTGQHDWYDCWDNTNSPNYRPNRQAGRGGRGRQQNWRGGRGFGRHNHHNNGGRNNYQQNYHNDPNQHQNQQQSYHNEQLFFLPTNYSNFIEVQSIKIKSFNEAKSVSLNPATSTKLSSNKPTPHSLSEQLYSNRQKHHHRYKRSLPSFRESPIQSLCLQRDCISFELCDYVLQ